MPQDLSASSGRRGGGPRIHFVINEPLANRLNQITFAERARYWQELTLTTESAWLGQSFLVLREFGWRVSCSPSLDNSAINAISADRIDRRLYPLAPFVVTFQSDLRWFTFGDAFIVQNPTQEDVSLARFYIPHWPPPLVIPRDTSRREVTRIGLMGIPWIRAAKASFFAELCSRFGLKVIDLWKEKRWHDYSDIDILIAIRSFDKRTHDTKPPWKLFTAWLARCPLVAGNDSAFAHEGRPGVDYLRVTTIDDLKQALLSLKDDPKLFHSIVEAGSEQLEKISLEAIEAKWFLVFNHHIFPRYEKLNNAGVGRHRDLRTLLVIARQICRAIVRNSKRLRGSKR